jgi:ABC-type lipoprotein release transport system permease subunit
MAFEIQITPMIVAMVLGGVAVVGALGAWFPARRASRLPVIDALREA